jgi:CHAT domain-containing protein
LKEATAIQTIAKKYHSELKHLSREQATVSAVLDGIAQYDWVHLACHGTQHATDPMKSAFILHDKKLRLDSLMAKAHHNTRLAFLSACETATGDQTLPEESVHLTSAMLAAGFPSVIGTMWAIADADAPRVAEVFYETLFKEGSASGWNQPLDVAYALHQAIGRLREEVGEEDFDRWVPFVHFGL